MLNNSISNAAFQCNQHTLSWASLLEKVTCSQLGAETAALHDVTVPLERSLKKAPWYLISVTVTVSLMWSSQNCLSKMHLIHYTWGLMSTRLGAGDMQRWNQHRKKKKTFKEFEFLCDDEKSVQSEWEFRDLGFGCESATSVEAPKLSEPQFSHL